MEFLEYREINAHAHTVRTRPAFWEGPGYEANIVGAQQTESGLYMYMCVTAIRAWLASHYTNPEYSLT